MTAMAMEAEVAAITGVIAENITGIVTNFVVALPDKHPEGPQENNPCRSCMPGTLARTCDAALCCGTVNDRRERY